MVEILKSLWIMLIYARHYKLQLVHFLPHLSLWLIIQRAVNITDNLCTKQGNSSIKSLVNNQELFQIKSGCTVHESFGSVHSIGLWLSGSQAIHSIDLYSIAFGNPGFPEHKLPFRIFNQSQRSVSKL
jgi:hypothetical protein